MRPRIAITLWIVLMSACASAETPPDADAPGRGQPFGPSVGSVLYLGPRFLTDDGEARALLVDGDGIVRRAYAEVPAPEPGVERRNLPGALALPGLIDAHLHLSWIGRFAEQLDVAGARSAAEVRTRVEAYAATHPEIQVVVGYGWDHTLWGGELPRATDLGDLAVPVYLERVDGHAVWLNRAAMARAKSFFDGPEVPGRRIERIADGPTGVVVDPGRSLLELIEGPVSAAALERWLAAGLAACADVGLVEVHDMSVSLAELAALQRLADRNLPLRVVVYLDDSDASFAWMAAHPEAPQRLHPDLTVAGVKLFADGALGSRGAALKADYSDQHGHRGLPTDLAQLVAKAERAAALGYPVAIHAIGDLGNDHALRAIEAALAVRPGLVHRIEHAQVVDLADLARFARTGTIASMQPVHAMSDMRWAEARVGPERVKGAYAWNTFLHRGIPLAFGSDAPYDRLDPLTGLIAAVFRQTASGEPPDGWRPSEALTFAEALHAFSGRIGPGAPFAVTLVDVDVAAHPESLRTAHVLGTVRRLAVRLPSR